MTEEEKQFIDSATYECLLRLWRQAPSGSSWFMGETGAYFATAMRKKRERLEDNGVGASKRIGWR